MNKNVACHPTHNEEFMEEYARELFTSSKQFFINAINYFFGDRI